MNNFFTLLFLLILIPLSLQAQLIGAPPKAESFKLAFARSNNQYNFSITNQTDHPQKITWQTHDLLGKELSKKTEINLESVETSDQQELFSEKKPRSGYFLLNIIFEDKQGKKSVITKKILLID